LDEERVRVLLRDLEAGQIDVEQAVDSLSSLPFVDTPDARVDTHRALRIGIPEVIFGPGKSAQQIIDIVRVLQNAGPSTLVTRIEAGVATAVCDEIGTGEYDENARLLYIGDAMPRSGKGRIAVVSAGTADSAVAGEAAGTARFFGNEVTELRDVGVAGIHRLLASQDVLRDARVLIVVAGMEGALPSVVGGMVDKPVIAVPTSVGYGAALGGLAALFGMLTSCASNVTVVNIDNGFGAAYAATLINRLD
jgi:NCAIR mutase (PurE)-related protein